MWIAVGIIGAAVVGGVASSMAADKSADASKEAAATQAGAQREQLDYLKEVDALPREYREKALAELGNTYLGPEGFQYPEGRLLDQAKNSELFSMLQKEGSDAVLRGASATGGLRSGSASEALADNTQRALMTAYQQEQQQFEMGLQGVASLANLPLQTTNIANTMGAIGQTQAQGQVAAGQAKAAGYQGVGTAVGQGIGNLAMAKGMGWI